MANGSYGSYGGTGTQPRAYAGSYGSYGGSNLSVLAGIRAANGLNGSYGSYGSYGSFSGGQGGFKTYAQVAGSAIGGQQVAANKSKVNPFYNENSQFGPMSGSNYMQQYGSYGTQGAVNPWERGTGDLGSGASGLKELVAARLRR